MDHATVQTRVPMDHATVQTRVPMDHATVQTRVPMDHATVQTKVCHNVRQATVLIMIEWFVMYLIFRLLS